jgi:predicted N-acetyltransferase YhbS
MIPRLLATLGIVAIISHEHHHHNIASAFLVPSTYGIGSLFFPIRKSVVTGISDNLNNANKRMELQEVSDFFVDAFWTGKVGGGAKTLSNVQRRQLEQSQNAEFTRRYGNSRRISEMLLVRNSNNNEIMACVGVELDKIPTSGTIRDPITTQLVPLMSNLAVSKKYRRRGLAERLVRSVEVMVRKEWGYNECYLYVEERNRPAVKLYSKLGYRNVWRDTTAKTLLPTTSGDLQSASTVIVCMKKTLYNDYNNIFQRLFQQ